MGDVVIHAEGLSKRYRLGTGGYYQGTFRDAFSTLVSSRLSRLRSARKPAKSRKCDENIWALKDVSFEVKRGEVLGIIGRNGAGKSTLLKILARITEPSEGFAEVTGRVGSLLEVGTGFHYELTGRENVYLSGALLGMRRHEIERKFEEIVEFAEVGKFIDTPVKRYSSGMNLRLAFSVAAHLEPEILLVDEVLAVGDVAFQRKCLGKMDDVVAQGRTVLFVSHNLAVVKELCQTSVVLNGGALEFRGPVIEGLSRYSLQLAEPSGDSRSGSGWSGLRLNGQWSGDITELASGQPLDAEVWLEVDDVLATSRLFCLIHDSAGDMVVHQRVEPRDFGQTELRPGRYRVAIHLPPLWFAPGVYTLHFKLLATTINGRDERHLTERAVFDVVGSVNNVGRASLAPPLDWELTPEVVFDSEEVAV